MLPSCKLAWCSICWVSLLTKRLHRKELGYKPCSTLSLVRKWGPSTRNIIRSLEAARYARRDPIEAEVRQAASKLGSNLWDILEGEEKSSFPQSAASDLVFIRRNVKDRDFGKSDRCIPTPHLVNIFEEYQRALQNLDSLMLFNALSSHSFTRTAAGWLYEKQLHAYLSGDNAALKIFRGSTEGMLRPSTHLLPSTLAGLRTAGVNGSFYWIPSVRNFPGIDSVLGDGDGNLFSIQVAIAEDHKSPEKGIKRLWSELPSEVRIGRTWNFVVVTESKIEADKYVKKFSQDLKDLKQGRAQQTVQVWGCAFQKT